MDKINDIERPPGAPNALGLDAAPIEELGKRERNKAEKEQRIIEAATCLFQERGFDETTTAEISRRARIGAGTLYLYVGSKDDLLVRVFQRVAGGAWSEAFEQVDPDASVIDQVTGVFVHVTAHHESSRRLASAFFKQLQAIGDPAREGVNEFMRDFYRQLTDLLETAKTAGRLDPDVPTRVLAANLFASWYVLMQRHTNGALAYDDVLDRLRSSIRVALWKLTTDD